MLRLGRLKCTNTGFDLLASLGEFNYLFAGHKTTKQLAFLMISSTPSLKNIAQIQVIIFSQINLISLFSVYLPYATQV